MKTNLNSYGIIYHVTGRRVNREPWPLPMDQSWNLYERYVHFLHSGFGIGIHNFVLMTNHFHMLVTDREGNIAAAMNYFMRETSRYFNVEVGRINQIYGRPYHKTLITSNHHFLCAYKYVYRNPVDAGICDDVFKYPYSTLTGLIGQQPLLIPLLKDHLFFECPRSVGNWLNTPYQEEHHRAIQLALRKKKFKIARSKHSSRSIKLEDAIQSDIAAHYKNPRPMLELMNGGSVAKLAGLRPGPVQLSPVNPARSERKQR